MFVNKWNPDNPKESTVTITVSIKTINLIVFVFNFVCILGGLVAIIREIEYVEIDEFQRVESALIGKDEQVVWNGFSNSTCFKAEPQTKMFSLMKRFQIEPYAKLGFRFAFMFTCFLRMFLIKCRSTALQHKFLTSGYPANSRSHNVIMSIYKMLPIIFVYQALLCCVILTCNTQLDEGLPLFVESTVYSFFYTTAIYMCFCIISDWTEANSLSVYLQTKRFTTRLLSYVVFIMSFMPVLTDYSAYLRHVTCHTYASSVTSGILEYLTLMSTFIFHMAEHFDVPNVELHFIEKK